MLTDQMLQVGLRCATAAAHGDDWAEPLVRGVASVVGTDAAFAVRFVAAPDGAQRPDPRSAVAASGVAAPGLHHLVTAADALPRHPTIGRYDWSGPSTTRVSDAVRLESFWTTDVWRVVHSYGDGRFPASVAFGRFGEVHVFLGVHRCSRDFSDEDMEVLDRVREPLGAALSFRYAWDAAAASLPDDIPHPDRALTRREGQVAALVSWGWTDARIARHLGISERTVRKHLENVRAKWQAPNRTAVASLYERRRD